MVNTVAQAVESCYNSYTRTQTQGALANHTKAFDQLTILLLDFSTIVSKMDENVTAVYESIQGECSS